MNWKQAFVLGLLAPGEWGGVQKEATMYRYNGVVLPKLPEWDKTAYPYAFILKSTDGASYIFVGRSSRPGVNRYSEEVGYYWYGGASGDNNRFVLSTDGLMWETATTTVFTGIPAWSCFDFPYTLDSSYIPDELEGTVYLAASEPIPVYECGVQEQWETLFEGEATNDPYYNTSGDRNGYLLWLWDYQLETGVNVLSVGDIVRVTLDGVVYQYTAEDDDGMVIGGNHWLTIKSSSSLYQDDGTDFCFVEMDGGLRGYTRTRGTHTVKFERKR